MTYTFSLVLLRWRASSLHLRKHCRPCNIAPCASRRPMLESSRSRSVLYGPFSPVLPLEPHGPPSLDLDTVYYGFLSQNTSSQLSAKTGWPCPRTLWAPSMLAFLTDGPRHHIYMQRQEAVCASTHLACCPPLRAIGIFGNARLQVGRIRRTIPTYRPLYEASCLAISGKPRSFCRSAFRVHRHSDTPPSWARCRHSTRKQHPACVEHMRAFGRGALVPWEMR